MAKRGAILMEKYELGRLLGKGTFAKVHHARNIASGHSVAIKIFDKEKIMKVGLVEQIKREISIMRMVRHPNVVQLFEVMASKSKIYFILEYAKGGELFQKIAKGKLQEEVVHKYFQQLISAVDYCHSRGVYHRDLKPENLLLDDDDENLKVTDFGLSALADSRRQDGLLHTTCGTPAYVAPEVIGRTGYDGAKADIWSCGVILFVLLAGYLPFHDSNLMDMYKKIEKGHFKCPSWFPYDVRKLIYKILDPNPNTRISIEKIKENKWFKKGYVDKISKTGAMTKDHVPGDVTLAFDSSCNGTSEGKHESKGAITALNAFDIISHSTGFDLSGLFEECNHRKEARFSSRRSASTIISKLERMAKHLKLKVKKKEGGVLKIEGMKEGRKGVLSIDAEIYQVTPSFHFVEIKKSNGDTIEYERILQEGIRPALKDIVWTWQGDEQQIQQQLLQQQQQ